MQSREDQPSQPAVQTENWELSWALPCWLCWNALASPAVLRSSVTLSRRPTLIASPLQGLLFAPADLEHPPSKHSMTVTVFLSPVRTSTRLNLTGFRNVVLHPQYCPFLWMHNVFIHSFGKCGLCSSMMPASQRNPEARRISARLALTIEWGGQRFIKRSPELIMLAGCPR